MYFVLEQERETAFMVSFEDANPGHDLKWSMGRLIPPDEKPSGLKLTVEEVRDAYPDYFTEVPVDFCSRRMRERLEAVGVDNIDYHPVEMVDEATGKHIDKYFAMNVLGRIVCMDRQRSQFTEWRKRIARIQSLVLDPAAIQGMRVFRMNEYPDVIVVDGDVAEALRGLPGVALRPAEGWSDAHRF
ncbi:hypothetical protein D7V97_30950 [Corallococcus sp. CA053C]|uniref:imm11 family protein n=1 Tax=Corallococcus sp. CA053C TaxID=2316732 RepID=UPI000EA267B4|nr:DUF1629 domain-containing protein [Corallococcus sp. CA053C]RKG99963.1 hypothetical protein D7V97_30950 [Corallococcus sp. CA053C]